MLPSGSIPHQLNQSGKLFHCQVVNFFSVTSGKLFECHKCKDGQLFHCHGGKKIQCHVVNFFIDIHNIWKTMIQQINN